MDANGTRYYLLLGRPDWGRCAIDPAGTMPLDGVWPPASPLAPDPDLYWDNGASELTLRPLAFQFIAAPRDVLPELDDRRGAARDAYGSWYWIARSKHEIIVRSSGSEQTTHYWSAADTVPQTPEPAYGDFAPVQPPDPPQPLELSGLAVTEDQYLVVGVLSPPGLLIFDLYAGGEPQRLEMPPGIPFVPFDIAARPKGGVWVLDRDNHRYWAFDRRFRLDPCEQNMTTLDPGGLEDFQPADAGAEPPRDNLSVVIPDGISLAAASPLALNDPIAIEGLPDGTVLILDYDAGLDYSNIYQYRYSHPIGGPLVSTEMREHLPTVNAYGEPLPPAASRPRYLRGHDLAFLPQRPVAQGTRTLIGRLYLASGEGNQTFVFDVFQTGEGLQIDALPIFLPMRLFGGKGIVAAGQHVYYDFDDRWLPLTEQRRPRYIHEAALHTPIDVSQPVLDGHDPDCVWHRLFLDACLPAGSEVVVSSRAADDLELLAHAPWQPEAAPYLRPDGSELPFVGRQGYYDTWELLFQNARGRYLQVRLVLRGNGQATPRIRAMRVYYPRFSYLTHYFPAVYQENDISASFVDRFLANFEGMFTGLEDHIAAAQVLLDPRSAPSEALDWLVSWFGVALDPSWTEMRRRQFIKYAIRFFEQRGTVNGLYMALQLAFDDCADERLFTTPLDKRTEVTGIRIVETFRTRRIPAIALGDPTDPAGLRRVSSGQRWAPLDGGARLQARYRDFVAANHLSDVLPATFPLAAPAERPDAWQQFVRAELGFEPSASADIQPRWAAFLARRYGSVSALNDRYSLIGSARYERFEDIPMPGTLPPDGEPLRDWYQFQAVVLAMKDRAHHFVVLLPMSQGAHPNPALQQEQLNMARRVIDLEKPAHTTYEVRFYWAMFRLGEVRLGHDTLIAQGSRSPELMSPLVLGQGQLVQSYLASGHDSPEGRAYLSGDRQ